MRDLSLLMFPYASRDGSTPAGGWLVGPIGRAPAPAMTPTTTRAVGAAGASGDDTARAVSMVHGEPLMSDAGARAGATASEQDCIRLGAERFLAMLEASEGAATAHRAVLSARPLDPSSGGAEGLSLYPMVISAHRVAYYEQLSGAVIPRPSAAQDAGVWHHEALGWLARLAGATPNADTVSPSSAWTVWREVEAQRARFAALHYLEHRQVVCRRFEREAIAGLIDELRRSLKRCFERLARRPEPPLRAEPTPFRRGEPALSDDDSAGISTTGGRRVGSRPTEADALEGLSVLSWTGRAALEAWARWSARTAHSGWVHGSDWSRFLRFALGRDWADAAARAFAVLEGLDAECTASDARAARPPAVAGSPPGRGWPRVALGALFHARESQRDVERLIEEIRSRMAMSPLPLITPEEERAPPNDHRVAMASTWRDLQVRRLDWRNRVQACLEPDGLKTLLDELDAGLAAYSSADPAGRRDDDFVRERLAAHLGDKWSQQEAAERPTIVMAPTTAVSER